MKRWPVPGLRVLLPHGANRRVRSPLRQDRGRHRRLGEKGCRILQEGCRILQEGCRILQEGCRSTGKGWQDFTWAHGQKGTMDRVPDLKGWAPMEDACRFMDQGGQVDGPRFEVELDSFLVRLNPFRVQLPPFLVQLPPFRVRLPPFRVRLNLFRVRLEEVPSSATRCKKKERKSLW